MIGIDEAGRGPVLGPLIIAGVLLDKKGEEILKKEGVKDSKELSPFRREALREIIEGVAKKIVINIIPAREIDKLRKHMSLNEIEAMKMAEIIEKMAEECQRERIVIDLPDPTETGFRKRIEKYISEDILKRFEIIAEHRADSKYVCTSAASIIAKTERDRIMRALEKSYGPLGSGYPHDPSTQNFLRKTNPWPDIVRKSWITAQRIENDRKQKRLKEWFGV